MALIRKEYRSATQRQSLWRTAKEARLEAIHKDGLTWTQVSDLKFWDNEVVKQYGVRAIPQNFLIGPDDVIMAKNIRGEELGKKLEALLKEKP